MNVRKIFITIIVFLLSALAIYGQNAKSNLFRDFDGKPLLYRNSNYDYITLSGDTLNLDVDKDLYFVEGKDSLRRYLRSEYLKFFKRTELEYNTIIFICVLFDENLNIVEVRNYTRSQYGKGMDEINELFRSAIMKTDGMWRLLAEEKRPKTYHFIRIAYGVY